MNMHKQRLLYSLLLLVPVSILQAELYTDKRSHIISKVLTTSFCLGLAAIAYKAMEPVVKRLMPDDASATSQLLLRGMGAATVGLAANALTGKAVTQSLYMSLSNRALLPEMVSHTLNKIDEYLMYLSGIESVEKQLNYVIDNLNAEKYHQNGLAERLLCLDGAYYHLKEHDLVAELKKECNCHRAHVQTQLNALQFYIDLDCPAADRLKKLSTRYKKIISYDPEKARIKAFKYVQAHQKHHLFEKLNEFDIHVKLYLKGFNQGINIIDEATRVNQLTRRLVDLISERLYANYESIKLLLSECERVKKLEKTVKAYTKRKLTIS